MNLSFLRLASKLAVLGAAVALPCCESLSVTNPTPTPTPGQRCRDIATRMVLSRTSVPTGLTANGAAECAFDRSKAELSCSIDWLYNNGCAVQSKTVRRYASVSGFTQEFSPAGRILAVSEQQNDTFQGGCFGTDTTTTSFTFDASSRLTRSQLARTTTREELAFTAWDSSGRPTTGTLGDLAFCSAVPVTVTYDDAARTWLTSAGSLGSACGFRERTILDGNRNLASYERAGGVPVISTTTTYTVLATAQVCD